MYRCADEKISKTENIVAVANRDVENLDHQTDTDTDTSIQ